MSLRLEQVGKTVRGQLHLDGIDLALEPGLHVLLGSTLAGKTSLMRIMAGLDRPTVGHLIEDGKDVTGTAPQRRRVGMVYQQFVNYPSLTVRRNIASPLARQGLDRAAIAQRVAEVASLLHIEKLLDRLPAQLSGGQQQRCAIARALVKDSSLLLLDEPLVNLDYKLREELRAELKAVFARRQAIVVYATTEPQEALVMGGRVIVLDEGRVLQTGPVLEVFHEPASTRVAAVFSDPPMNTIDGSFAGGTAKLGRVTVLPVARHMEALAGGTGGSYRFGVRASHLGIARAGEADAGDGRARLEGAVDLAEISGSETFVHVRHRDGSWIVQCEGVRDFALGEPVVVTVDPASVFVFDGDGRLRAAPGREREA